VCLPDERVDDRPDPIMRTQTVFRSAVFLFGRNSATTATIIRQGLLTGFKRISTLRQARCMRAGLTADASSVSLG